MSILDLFRKKPKADTGWMDIDLETFGKIRSVTEDKLPGKEVRIRKILYGDGEGSLAFLSAGMPKVDYRDSYWLNGHRYALKAKMPEMTTSQFCSIVESKDDYDRLSSVLIPWGHQYSDGYDMDVVKDDIKRMRMPDVVAIANFLVRQLQVLLELIRESSEIRKSLELARINPSTILDPMESLLSSSEYLRQSMYGAQS